MNRAKFLLATALVAPIALGATAQAADLPAPVFEPVAPIIAPVVEPFTWAGAYVGVTAGFAFVDENDDDDNGLFDDDEDFNVFGDNGDDDDDDDEFNFVGGALAGFNAQFGSFVVGYETWMAMHVEAENRRSRFEERRFDEALNREVRDVGQFDGTAEMYWLATTRLRAGVAFDRFLVYGTGGLAFAHIDLDGRFRRDFDVDLDNGFHEESGNRDGEIETGWTIGAGVEAAFTDNLTARLGYLYADFEIDGDDDDDFEFGFDDDDNGNGGFDFQTHIVRAAVTAKFNFGDMFGR